MAGRRDGHSKRDTMLDRVINADVQGTDRPLPADSARQTHEVLHVARAFGRISETFVVDTMLQVEREGWRSWLATGEVAPGHPFSFPPDERIQVGERRSRGARLRDHLSLRGPGQSRDIDWTSCVPVTHPEVIHAHFGWSAIDVIPLARRLRAPLVATFHGSDVTIFPRIGRRERLLMRTPGRAHKYVGVFKHIDGVIAVSEFIERALRDLGLEGPVDIIPAGVRLDRFPFRGALALDGPARLLFVGRLVPYKAADLVIRAFADVRARHHDAHLEIIGDGPDGPALHALARDLGVERAIDFRGAQPRSEVIEAVRRAHVQVMGARPVATGAAEGSPVVAKEAQAVGAILVAMESGGTRETIPPEDRGRVVPGDDHAALAAELLRVLGEPERWPDRAARARRYMEEHFDWDVLGRRTVETYERAIAEHAARQR